MTHLTLTINSYLQSPIEGLIGLIKSFIETSKANRNANITIKELSKLSDKELKDIGILRGDIYAIAHGDRDLLRGVK